MAVRKQGTKGAAKGRGKGKGSPKGGYGALPPKESQRISLEQAIELTQRYRKAAPASEHAGFFWADGLQAILSQPGCVGIRYYHGLGPDGTYQPVIVGVDESGNDITKVGKARKGARTAALASAGEAVLLDQHYPCPPYCPTDSPLL
ncbi:MAG: hypothetical protein IPJ56_10920 [Gemmatimonadetes bacterium]|nr:hypothetical protein [Gemmatimonadota bacterium]